MKRIPTHLESNDHSRNAGWILAYRLSSPQPFELIRMLTKSKKQSTLWDHPSTTAVKPIRFDTVTGEIDPLHIEPQPTSSSLETPILPQLEATPSPLHRNKKVGEILDSVCEHLDDQKEFETKQQQTEETALEKTGSQCLILTEENAIKGFYKDNLQFKLREDFTMCLPPMHLRMVL